jgi:chemotaxis protein MotB
MARKGGRHRRGGHGGGEESGERWLLTYADMITLLMALFMVLFSISSVNISKVEALQESLRAAFSGAPLPGGKSLMHPGSSSNSSKAPTAVDVQSIVPITAPQTSQQLQEHSGSTSSSAIAGGSSGGSSTSASAAAATQQSGAAEQESEEFARIKHELDEYARSHHFGSSVQTTIEARGLVIRVLTDDLLFASGQAALDSRSDGLLGEISQLLNVDETHPIDVEGNTDDVPIHSSVYPSNWELSTARASTVVQFLIAHDVSPQRLTAIGYADERPVASNTTAQGRAKNRRVEIVLRRIYGSNSEP